MHLTRRIRLEALVLAAAALLAAPAAAQCPIDDAFEDNDSCATASVLQLGLTSDLVVKTSSLPGNDDPDYWVVPAVPPGHRLTVDCFFDQGLFDGDIDLFLSDDPGCTNTIDQSSSPLGDEQVRTTNTSGASHDYYVTVSLWSQQNDCNEYDLLVTVVPDPCLTEPDDSFEPDDDCSSPAPVGDGSYTDLFVSETDEDFYEVRVAAGSTLTVDVLHFADDGDLDVYLYDDPVACGDLSSYLVAGFSPNDDESIAYTNGTGAARDYWIQVVVSEYEGYDCNRYDMTISGSEGPSARPFCLGDGSANAGGGPVSCPCGNGSPAGEGEGCLNSTGQGATLSVSGTSVVANDDLVFTVAQGVPHHAGLLIQGRNRIAAPFRDGILCMGAPTERIEIFLLDAAGGGSTSSSIATEGQASPGDTRYYQFWYRNVGGVSPCGGGSNLTQGLIVDWL